MTANCRLKRLKMKGSGSKGERQDTDSAYRQLIHLCPPCLPYTSRMYGWPQCQISWPLMHKEWSGPWSRWAYINSLRFLSTWAFDSMTTLVGRASENCHQTSVMASRLNFFYDSELVMPSSCCTHFIRSVFQFASIHNWFIAARPTDDGTYQEHPASREASQPWRRTFLWHRAGSFAKSSWRLVERFGLGKGASIFGQVSEPSLTAQWFFEALRLTFFIALSISQLRLKD